MPAKRRNKGPTPIENLDQGTLWYIFSMNTHVGLQEYPRVSDPSLPARFQPPLTTTRLTSQVCRRWRYLLLSSPSVWASALDLECLNQSTNEWRNEVLRRTKNAVLTIHGNVCGGLRSTEFFLSILNDHWTRVRGLCVFILKGVDDKIWLCLRKPAPSLEFFHVHIGSNEVPASAVSLSIHAPLLASLVVSYIPFNLTEVPLLPHLRKLKLAQGSSFTISRFLHVLQDMSSLQSLEIGHVLVDSVTETHNVLPYVSLSRLMELQITENFPVATTFLAHIVPASGCNFYLDIMQELQSTVTTKDLSLWSQISSTFFSTCRLPPRDELSWSVNCAGSIRLEDAIPSGGFFSKSSSFVMCIEGHSPDLQGVPYAIAQGLSSCDLRSITRLYLAFEPGILDASNASFGTLLSGLTSVEALYTYVSALSFIIDVQSHANESVPLPSLMALFLREDDDEEEDWDTAVIMQFLLQRRDAGVPITTLELPPSHQHRSRFLFLRGINGLEVNWIEESDAGSREGSDEGSDDSMVSMSD